MWRLEIGMPGSARARPPRPRTRSSAPLLRRPYNPPCPPSCTADAPKHLHGSMHDCLSTYHRQLRDARSGTSKDLNSSPPDTEASTRKRCREATSCSYCVLAAHVKCPFSSFPDASLCTAAAALFTLAPGWKLICSQARVSSVLTSIAMIVCQLHAHLLNVSTS